MGIWILEKLLFLTLSTLLKYSISSARQIPDSNWVLGDKVIHDVQKGDTCVLICGSSKIL